MRWLRMHHRGLDGVYKSTNSGSSTFSVIYAGSDDEPLLHGHYSWVIKLLLVMVPESNAKGKGATICVLAADPNNADIVFLGGVNTWKSTDGGIFMVQQ